MRTRCLRGEHAARCRDRCPDEAFDGTDVAWAYSAAWCACRVLAERAGEAILVALARPLPSDPQVTRLLTRQARFEIVLRRDTGWNVRDLVTAWRASLAFLAGRAASGATAASRNFGVPG